MSTQEMYHANEAWVERMLDWYSAVKRDLPWRRSRDPYAVLVSEVMLQQTRIETVIGYYDRFMRAYPTAEALAEAPEEDVLKLWEGLGYYSRARNLQKAAKQIAAAGGFPNETEEIRKLAGVGDYTAAAVASIAFGRRAAAVDGNVTRVIARLYGLEDDTAQPAVRRKIAEILEPVIPEPVLADDGASDRGPGEFTQALMELGELICIPKVPRCENCPLREMCAAVQTGRTAELPYRSPKAAPVAVHRWIAVIRREPDGAVLLHRRPAKGLLAGSWEFPGTEKLPEGCAASEAGGFGEPFQQSFGGAFQQNFGEAFRQEYGISIRPLRYLGEVRHVFTHREWIMQIFEAALEQTEEQIAADDPAAGTDWCWEDLRADSGRMMATAFRKIRRLLI